MTLSKLVYFLGVFLHSQSDNYHECLKHCLRGSQATLSARLRTLDTETQTQRTGTAPPGQESALPSSKVSKPLPPLCPPSPLFELCREKLNYHFPCPDIFPRSSNHLSCLCFKTQNLNSCVDQLRPWEFIQVGEVKFKHLEAHAQFFTVSHEDQGPWLPENKSPWGQFTSSRRQSYSVEVNQTNNLTF